MIVSPIVVNRSHPHSGIILSVALACVVIVSHGSEGQAANKAEIKASIDRGVGALRGQVEKARTNDGGFRDGSGLGEVALASYAMLKGGADHDDKLINDVADAVAKRATTDQNFTNTDHWGYQASIFLMLLVDLDPDKYRDAIERLSQLIIEGQNDNGSWDYPNLPGGDTSVTQYACLGLWAAERAGIEVPNATWSKCILWHAKVQSNSGSFGYKYQGTKVHERPDSYNLTAAAAGSSLISVLNTNPEKSRFLGGLVPKAAPKPKPTPERKQEESKKGLGFLTKVEINEPEPDTKVQQGPPINVGAADGTAGKAMAWVAQNYQQKGNNRFRAYSFYTIERAASLANVEKLGPVDWYNSGADFVISEQKEDGTWSWESRPITETSFVVLFLARSTAKMIGPRQPPPDSAGAGLLQGGRGLPEDLSEVEFENGQIMVRKQTGPLDELLASLQTPSGDVDLGALQTQIVEQVQLGDRETLIGQVDQLLKLVEHPDAEVRRTAVWAVGRTGDLNYSRQLITALEDPDASVAIEARNALCWISRKPLGFGLPADPLATLGENAPVEQKAAAVAAWRKAVFKKWGQWYLDNGPYAGRGDAFEAALLKKLSQL